MYRWLDLKKFPCKFCKDVHLLEESNLLFSTFFWHKIASSKKFYSIKRKKEKWEQYVEEKWPLGCVYIDKDKGKTLLLFKLELTRACKNLITIQTWIDKSMPKFNYFLDLNWQEHAEAVLLFRLDLTRVCRNLISFDA